MKLALPWRVAPLEGKYYATEIVDAEGRAVLDVGIRGDGEPSRRELGLWMQWTDEPFEASDSHYETEEALWVAERIVEAMNSHEH